MPTTNAKVTVIIPTMATIERAELLKRAIRSIRVSSVSPILILAVVNGDRKDQGTCEWLQSQADIQFEYNATPSAPAAVCRGRELVQTEYFSTLDDDDEYLGLATDEKLKTMTLDVATDIVVTNGFRHKNGMDTMFYDNMDAIKSDPLASLMKGTWLHNCNALYRTASVETEYFQDSHPYGEWTWLAFKLAMRKKTIRVLDKPLFRYNDTEGSLSKSEAYSNAYFSLFERMLDLRPPTSIKRQIQIKMGSAWHDAAVIALGQGKNADAWRRHLKSLAQPGGFKYLSFTRYLLRPSTGV